MTLRTCKGAALITALLIVALIVTTVGTMFMWQRLSLRRTQLIINADQSFLYAQGVEQWAMGVLKGDIKEGSLINWPKVLPPTPVQGGTISGEIIDLQSRYNINRLINGTHEDQFSRLLKVIDNDVTDLLAQEIENAIAVWISSEDGMDKELNDYVTLYEERTPPYKMAHRLMVSPTELRMVNNVTDKRYQLLLPYITTLPKIRLPININTVSPEVLMVYGEEMTLEDARSLTDLRNSLGGFQTIEDFLEVLPPDTYNLKEKDLTTVSEYFLCRADVKLGKQHFILYSLLKRLPGKEDEPAVVELQSQSRGTL